MKPSPWLLPLQVLAGALGAAILVLLVMWLGIEPPVAPATAGETGRAAEATVERSSGGIVERTPALAADSPPPPADAGAAALSPARAVLYGAITSAGGEAIRDGVLWLYRDAAHTGTESMRTGTYSFAGLEPGRYRLRSRIPDELPLDRDVDVAAPATRLDIELPARWLLRVDAVTPAGEPLLPAITAKTKGHDMRLLAAAAFTEPPTADLPLSNHAETDAGLGAFRMHDPFRMRGQAALPKQTVGMLTLPPDRPVHVALMLRNHVVASLPADPGQETLTFTLDVDAFLRHLAKVRLRIVDGTGAPVAGARVALNDAQTGGGGRPTGDDGRIELENLKPGRLDLEIGHQSLRAPPQQVDVLPGADLDLGDVVLLPAVRVEFELANFEGRGAVRFNLLDPLPPGHTCDDGYISRENGSLWPMDMYPGRYGFLAAAENGVAIVELDLHQAPAGPVRFELRPGAPLTIESRVGAGFAHFELTTPAGTIVRRRELTGTSSELVRLPPGRYVATMTDRTGAVVRREITLTAAGATITVP